MLGTVLMLFHIFYLLTLQTVIGSKKYIVETKLGKKYLGTENEGQNTLTKRFVQILQILASVSILII
jgi:hypothetical protein